MDGIRACDVHCHGYVAQSVERPTETGEVAGSSPAVATVGQRGPRENTAKAVHDGVTLSDPQADLPTTHPRHWRVTNRIRLHRPGVEPGARRSTDPHCHRPLRSDAVCMSI